MKNLLLKESDLISIERQKLRFLPACRPGYLWLSQLDPEQKYQRPLDIRRVKRMEKAYSADQISPIKVNYRDGNWNVIDGQHTLEMIRNLSGDEDVIVFVMYYEEALSYTEEAAIFSEQATFSKPLSPTDIFFAKLEAGCDEQMIVNMILARHGLHAARHSSETSTRGVFAIKEIMTLYTQMGEETLDSALDVIIECWDYSPESLKRNIIKGVATVLYRFKGTIDLDLACKKWSQVSVQSINRIAREKIVSKNAYARALVDIYNRRTKNRLNSDLLLE